MVIFNHREKFQHSDTKEMNSLLELLETAGNILFFQYRI